MGKINKQKRTVARATKMRKIDVRLEKEEEKKLYEIIIFLGTYREEIIDVNSSISHILDCLRKKFDPETSVFAELRENCDRDELELGYPVTTTHVRFVFIKKKCLIDVHAARNLCSLLKAIKRNEHTKIIDDRILRKLVSEDEFVSLHKVLIGEEPSFVETNCN